eukprot:1159145-Pelagomonas_calceolata.AAC.14
MVGPQAAPHNTVALRSSLPIHETLLLHRAACTAHQHEALKREREIGGGRGFEKPPPKKGFALLTSKEGGRGTGASGFGSLHGTKHEPTHFSTRLRETGKAGRQGFLS